MFKKKNELLCKGLRIISSGDHISFWESGVLPISVIKNISFTYTLMQYKKLSGLPWEPTEILDKYLGDTSDSTWETLIAAPTASHFLFKKSLPHFWMRETTLSGNPPILLWMFGPSFRITSCWGNFNLILFKENFFWWAGDSKDFHLTIALSRKFREKLCQGRKKYDFRNYNIDLVKITQ